MSEETADKIDAMIKGKTPHKCSNWAINKNDTCTISDELGYEYKHDFFSSTLQEADYILNGDRQADYADPKENFERIAKIVSIATNKNITPSDIATVMITIKLLRENNKHKRDNCVDGAAYFEIMNRVNENSHDDI